MSATLEQAHARCRRIVAERARNFSYAFLALPAARRQALEAIYAYCRVADDLADEEGLPAARRAERLADLRARLRAALPEPGDPPAPLLAPDPELDPLLLALADAARRYGVRRDDLDLVARGCEQDLRLGRYDSFAGLHGYCYQVASAVGLACLPVFGHAGAAPELVRPLAEDLGIAMQLTNIIRDVREDLERDRVYLPQDELAAFGVDEDQLRAGRMDGRLRALLGFQVERARRYFVSGRRLVPWVTPSSRVCPLALASIYEALLGEIERRGFDVFSGRVALGPARKLGLMGLALGRGLLPC